MYMYPLSTMFSNQIHHNVAIEGTPGAYALLSNRATKNTAAIFVHGFDGDPWTTWQHFQSMFDLMAIQYPWLAETDFYFYGYTNFDKLLQANAQECLAFVRSVFPRPSSKHFHAPLLGWSPTADNLQRTLNKTRGLLVPEKYEKLLLIGHSLGGALLRLLIWQVLRDSLNENPPDPDQKYPDVNFDTKLLETDRVLSADLCLYAPAHLEIAESSVLGALARIIRKIPYFGGAVLSAVGLSLPVYPTVLGQDQVLADVRTYTEDSWEEHRYVPALRARILWGGSDRIVNAWGFKHDTPVEYVEGVGHMTVCKPSLDFTKPLDFLSHGHKRDTATHKP
jgi:hypothetical protein